MSNLEKFLPLGIIIITGGVAFGTAQSDINVLKDENRERKEEIRQISENKMELVEIRTRLEAIEKEKAEQNRMLKDILREVKK